MCDSLPSSHLLFPCALRFSNEYYENLVRKSFNTSSGRARSCNWNMARDICEANDFGLSACRVQRKSICTRSIKISRLPHGFEYIQACANDLSFNKLLKFTLKSVFENFYFACGFILMSNFFVYICTCTYTGASTSFMFKSYRSFLLQAKSNNCEAYCFSIFVFGAIPFVNYYETKTQTEMFQIWHLAWLRF